MTKKVTLKFKRCDDTPQITFPTIEFAKQTLSSEGGIDEIMEVLETLQGTHTADILKLIVDWSPKGGMHTSMMARWLEIARRLNKVKREKVGQQFTLNAEEADLVWQRLKGKHFKHVFSLAFAEFVADFMEKADVSWNEEEDSEKSGP